MSKNHLSTEQVANSFGSRGSQNGLRRTYAKMVFANNNSEGVPQGEPSE